MARSCRSRSRSVISIAGCASSAAVWRRTTGSSSTAWYASAPGSRSRRSPARSRPSPPAKRNRNSAMRFTHLFIDRPILATVISVFLTLIGLGALLALPVAQYPEIVPPTVQVTTSYPGASAQVVSETVATPLEQEINGGEHTIYMSSQTTGDGKLTITVTFRIGTDLNVAQMLTQNRVQDALPRLPD